MDKLLVVVLVIAAVGLAFSVILVCAAFAMTLLVAEFEGLLQHIPESPSDQYKILIELFGISVAALTALIGIGFAIFTYRRTSEAAELARRKQHTITILFETRLSEYFQTINKHRKAIFPTDHDIFLDQWNAARKSNDDARTKGADALQQLLNYYEFLAVGIAQGDLDEELLKSSIRGIMCNLVDDARFMIAELRQNDPKTLEHLVRLYDSWREEKLNYAGVTSERAIPSRRALKLRQAQRVL